MSAKTFPKIRHETDVSVMYDAPWNTMVLDDVFEKTSCSLNCSCCFIGWDEMGHLCRAVCDDQERIIGGTVCCMGWHIDPAHGNALPFADWQLDWFDKSMGVSMVCLCHLKRMASQDVLFDAVTHFVEDEPSFD